MLFRYIELAGDGSAFLRLLLPWIHESPADSTWLSEALKIIPCNQSRFNEIRKQLTHSVLESAFGGRLRPSVARRNGRDLEEPRERRSHTQCKAAAMLKSLSKPRSTVKNVTLQSRSLAPGPHPLIS